jgi:hypothetical protein
MRHASLTAIAALISALSISGHADAAMAPQFERWSELQAVMADRSIPMKLYAHGAVERLEVTPQGSYRFWAGNCYVEATVTVQPSPGMTAPGRTGLRVWVSEARCA